jgi:site-specific DNA-methyltransferase (adenine-specific)
MKISHIKVGNRFRSDLGNIDEVIDSVKTNGLLCPIIITRENLLIDGLRRMDAYRQLSIQDIPVHIVDIPIRENGEIDANLVRKDFTAEEILAIKKYRESTEPNLQGKRTDLASTSKVSEQEHQLHGNLPRSSIKKRQERIAKDTGLSYKSLARLEEVADMEKKHPELGELIGKIDSGKMKLNQAWKITKAYKKREQCLAQAKGLENRHNENFKLFHGDFRQRIEEEVPDNSVDLLFTDPPYDRGSLQLYADLGRIAARVLKPGGSLVFYAPHHSLLEMGSYMMQCGLKQIWTMCIKHVGHLARIHSLHLHVNWKPMIWLVKGESPNVIADAGMEDLIISAPPDKGLHEWAQSLTEADYMIKHLTFEGQVVLDCFMGSGTTGLAALNNKRQFIGIEIDQQTFEIAKARLQSVLPAVSTIGKKASSVI